MQGLGIRLYTDEDVPARVASELRRRGYDVLACKDAGNANRGLPDEWQLQFASDGGRALLTHNIVHFVQLDHRWKEEHQTHAGIVAVPNRVPIGELVRRISLHLDTVSPEAQRDLLLFLRR